MIHAGDDGDLVGLQLEFMKGTEYFKKAKSTGLAHRSVV